MSTSANYCGIILLLRQLAECGCCSEKEANKIAAQIGVKLGIDVKLPIG